LMFYLWDWLKWPSIWYNLISNNELFGKYNPIWM
jgi:hypothetical protein